MRDAASGVVGILGAQQQASAEPASANYQAAVVCNSAAIAQMTVIYNRRNSGQPVRLHARRPER